MTRVLLALVTMLSASAAVAESAVLDNANVYKGRNGQNQKCRIYFKKLDNDQAAIGVKHGDGQIRYFISNQTIVSSDRKVKTYSLVYGDKVKADTAVFKDSNLITATEFPMSDKGYCQAKFR